MRIMKWIGLFVFMLLAVGVVAAQDEIALTPYTDQAFGVQGVLPEGWTKVGPGYYVRGQSATDVTLMAQQAAPAPLTAVIASLLPQLQLSKLPESVGTVETAAFTWTLYKTDVTAAGVTATVDLALAEADGKSYIVLLQAAPEEYDALHESLFLPALDAYAPLAEATPDPSLPYTAEEVTFANGDIILSGTLTLPEGNGRHPVVVLVTGSGPQDRDESLAPATALKPFALIADYLTRQGIAVLRYDDRGVGESGGDYAAADLDDFTADATAAVDYLLTRAEIDTEQIGLLGHSEGGMVASKLGASNPNLAFIVALAGPGVPGDELLRLQNRLIVEANGGSEELAAVTVEFVEKMIDAVQADDLEAVQAITREYALKQIEAMPDDQRAALGDPETYAQTVVDQVVAGYFNDWFRSIMAYNAADDWAQTTIPVLAIFGGKDVQVDDEQNAPPLAAALETAGNTDYEIVTLPTANHLFQDAQTGGTAEYGTLPAEFIPDLLPTIGDWILDHVTLPE